LLALKQELGLAGFNLPTASPLTTPELVRDLKNSGCWLTLWFGHSTDVADRFYESGVDGFVTGMPSSLRTYIESKPQG
jgi:glycerophosphoryl diester phosphodiesterase